MKILFCYYIPSGGMETLNRQRFKALIQNGITSHFLYLRKGTGLQNRMDTKVVVTNENHKIKEMIEQEQYDAIIVCSDHTLLQRIKSLGYKGLVIYELQGLGKNKRYARSYLQFTARDMLNRFSDALLYPKTKHLSELIEELFPHKKKNFLFTIVLTQKRSSTDLRPLIQIR